MLRIPLRFVIGTNCCPTEMPSPVSSPVSSLGSQSARKATPRRSPRPRKVTASGPRWPSSDSSDDDEEEVRRLEAALAAAKAKRKRRQPLDDVTIEAIRAVAASRELCRNLEAASHKELQRLAALCGIKVTFHPAINANQRSTVILAKLEKLVEEGSLPPPPAPKSARTAAAASGYDTLDADALTKHWSSRVRGDDEAYFRQMRRDHMAAMGIPLSDSEPEDDGSDSEEEEN